MLDELLSQGLIYCDPSRESNFWRPTPSALLALGLRSSTDIPALKELEEWFDVQKEIREIDHRIEAFRRIVVLIRQSNTRRSRDEDLVVSGSGTSMRNSSRE